MEVGFYHRSSSILKTGLLTLSFLLNLKSTDGASKANPEECKFENLTAIDEESWTPSFSLTSPLAVNLKSDKDGWQQFSIGFAVINETTTGSLDFQKDPEDSEVILTLTNLFEHVGDPTAGLRHQIVKLPKDVFQLFSENWTSLTLEVVENKLKLTIENNFTVNFNEIDGTNFVKAFLHVSQGEKLFVSFNCSEETDIPITKTGSSHNDGAIVGGIMALVILLAVVIIVVFYLKKRKKLKGNEETGTGRRYKSDESCAESVPLQNKDDVLTGVPSPETVEVGNILPHIDINLKNDQYVRDQGKGLQEREFSLHNKNDPGDLQQGNVHRNGHGTTIAVTETSKTTKKGACDPSQVNHVNYAIEANKSKQHGSIADFD